MIDFSNTDIDNNRTVAMQISVPHSILKVTDPNALAFLLLLLSKPAGQAVSGQEVRDQYKMGKSAYWRARRFLLHQNLIREIKRVNAQGHFDGVSYLPVSHETEPPNIERGDSPECDKSSAVDLARSVQRLNLDSKIYTARVKQQESCSKHNSNNNVGENKFRKTQNYPADFERLWNTFDPTFGSKGTKQEAYKEFKKLGMSSDDVTWLIDRLKAEINRKTEAQKTGWEPPFQHVSRVLKNKAWESWQQPQTKTNEFFL